MPGPVPESRFRLQQTFSLRPDLQADVGPGRSFLIGQNAQRQALEAIYLGRHAEPPHRGVWMDVRGAHVLYVMGKRRSGKSYTLGGITEALVSDSWIRQGTWPQSVLVLDTMNVFLTMPFAVAETEPTSSVSSQDLNKWEIPSTPLPITLFAPSATFLPSELPQGEITLRASDLGAEEWCGLFEVDPFVDPLGQLLATIHTKLAGAHAIAHNLSDDDNATVFSINDMLGLLDTDPDALAFASDTREALRRRLAVVVRQRLFGSSGLDLRYLIQPGRVSVLLLRDLEPEMRSVIVALIVKRLMRLRGRSEQLERLVGVHNARAAKFAEADEVNKARHERDLAAAYSAEAQKGLPRCWLVIDEAHNYIPARASATSKKPLKKFVDEGRNLGLSIVVATQQPAGLDPSIQRNADLLLMHALSHHDDIVAAQGMINTALPDEIVVDGRTRLSGAHAFEGLIRMLPLGYALASSDRANRLFPVQIRPRSTVHGGAEY